MDKKTKKKIEVLRQKQAKTQKLLNDAKAQTDDPEEVKVLQQQIDAIKAEIEKLKAK